MFQFVGNDPGYSVLPGGVLPMPLSDLASRTARSRDEPSCPADGDALCRFGRENGSSLRRSHCRWLEATGLSTSGRRLCWATVIKAAVPSWREWQRGGAIWLSKFLAPAF